MHYRDGVTRAFPSRRLRLGVVVFGMRHLILSKHPGETPATT